MNESPQPSSPNMQEMINKMHTNSGEGECFEFNDTGNSI